MREFLDAAHPSIAAGTIDPPADARG